MADHPVDERMFEVMLVLSIFTVKLLPYSFCTEEIPPALTPVLLLLPVAVWLLMLIPVTLLLLVLLPRSVDGMAWLDEEAALVIEMVWVWDGSVDPEVALNVWV